MHILNAAFIVVGMIGLLSIDARAQDVDAPTTTPEQQAPYVMTKPDGMITVELGGRTVVTDPENELWVKTALQAFKPSDRPTTMPNDVLGKLKENQAAIVSKLSADLALPNAAIAQEFVTESAQPAIEKVAAYHPRVFYLVLTRDRAQELVKGGWECPRFIYREEIDQVVMVPGQLTIGNTSDLVVPVFFAESDSTGKKLDAVTQGIDMTEAGFDSLVADEALNALYGATLKFIEQDVFEPLELKPGQEWLSRGTAAVLGAQIGAMATGISLEQYLAVTTGDSQNNPLRPATLDLFDPWSLDAIRADRVPFYLDAHRRKSGRVVQKLVERGADVMPKILAAMRKNPPADAAALVALVREISGIDVTADLRPN